MGTSSTGRIIHWRNRDPGSPLSSQVRAALLLAAVFLAVMALFFIYHDAYRDVAGNLIAGGDFAQSPLGDGGAAAEGRWRVRGPSIQWEPHGGVDASGGVRLATQQGRGSSLGYTVENPRRFQFLRLSARLRSDDIVVGNHAWNTARLLILFTDRNGRPQLERDYVACVITGSQPWRYCERVFPVPDFAITSRAHVQNLAGSGTVWVDDLRLTPAVEKSATPFWRALFAAAWCGVLAYCVWSARLWRQPLGLLIIAIGLVIVFGVAAPETAIERIVHRGAHTVTGLVNGDAPEATDSPEAQTVRSPGSPAPTIGPQSTPVSFRTVFTVKKTGHFVLFSLLAFLAFWSVIRRRRAESGAARSTAAFVTVAAALLVFAAGAEILQFLTTTRRPAVLDWVIDAGGILIGATIALVASRFARNAFTARPAA